MESNAAVLESNHQILPPNRGFCSWDFWKTRELMIKTTGKVESVGVVDDEGSVRSEPRNVLFWWGSSLWTHWERNVRTGYHMGLLFPRNAKAPLWLSTSELSYRKPCKTDSGCRIDCKYIQAWQCKSQVRWQRLWRRWRHRALIFLSYKTGDEIMFLLDGKDRSLTLNFPMHLLSSQRQWPHHFGKEKAEWWKCEKSFSIIVESQYEKTVVTDYIEWNKHII